MELQVRPVRPTERIYKTITLNASRGRAWRAISEPHEFGKWLGATFGAAFHRPFARGATVTGVFTSGAPVELAIVDVDPDHRVSFRWHSFAAEPGADGGSRSTTLVELQLETEPEGVVITVTESGFGRLPRARIEKTFAASAEGWDERLEALKKYIEES